MARWVKEVVALKSGAGTPLWTMDHFGPFFALLPHKNPKKQNFEKMKKNKQKNTWIYYHFTHVYRKWKSYDVWFLRYGAWRTEFFVISDNFLPFYPAKNPKTKILKKWKKLEISGDIILLHKSTKNYDHMPYCFSFWDMEHDRCNWYFSFWAIFCPFPPSHHEKWKFQKNEKKA